MTHNKNGLDDFSISEVDNTLMVYTYRHGKKGNDYKRYTPGPLSIKRIQAYIDANKNKVDIELYHGGNVTVCSDIILYLS